MSFSECYYDGLSTSLLHGCWLTTGAALMRMPANLPCWWEGVINDLETVSKHAKGLRFREFFSLLFFLFTGAFVFDSFTFSKDSSAEIMLSSLIVCLNTEKTNWFNSIAYFLIKHFLIDCCCLCYQSMTEMCLPLQHLLHLNLMGALLWTWADCQGGKLPLPSTLLQGLLYAPNSTHGPFCKCKIPALYWHRAAR